MTVIDLTHVMAGPFCTYILGLLGAKVIKIERLGEGDVMRHYDNREQFVGMAPSFQAINAGKKSIAIDLKQPDGIALVHKLIGSADIVVENFRPGVLERLGLGYQACRAVKPDLIYCSMSGFGQNGPMRDNPAYDHIVQAVCGVMSLTGEPEGGPCKVGFPMVDTFTGYAGALAVLSAVVKRARFGGGEYIDLAMLDSALLLMISMIGPFLIAGDIPKRVGNRGFNPSPTAATFMASDGPLLLGANTQKQFEEMCRVIGHPELIDDPRFANPASRIENAADLVHVLKSAFSGKTAIAWETLFNAVSVPAAAVRSIPQIVQDPHTEARGITSSFALHGGGTGHTLNLGFDMGRPAGETLDPPPLLGEHTDAILSGLGMDLAEIRSLHERKIV